MYISDSVVFSKFLPKPHYTEIINKKAKTDYPLKDAKHCVELTEFTATHCTLTTACVPQCLIEY